MLKGVLYFKLESVTSRFLGPLMRHTGQSMYRAGVASQGSIGHEDRIVPSMRCVPISDAKYPRLLDVRFTSKGDHMFLGWLDRPKCNCHRWRETRSRLFFLARSHRKRRHCRDPDWKEQRDLGFGSHRKHKQQRGWRQSHYWRQCVCRTKCSTWCLHTWELCLCWYGSSHWKGSCCWELCRGCIWSTHCWGCYCTFRTSLGWTTCQILAWSDSGREALDQWASPRDAATLLDLRWRDREELQRAPRFQRWPHQV